MVSAIVVLGRFFLAILLAASVQGGARNDDSIAKPCCQICESPRAKYYSVDGNHDLCGEACILPSLYPIYKVFEKNLTAAVDGQSCATQRSQYNRRYTQYNSTVRHGLPGLSIELDLYAPGPPK